MITPAGHKIHVNGSPLMTPEDRLRLANIMDAAVKRYSCQHETMATVMLRLFERRSMFIMMRCVSCGHIDLEIIRRNELGDIVEREALEATPKETTAEGDTTYAWVFRGVEYTSPPIIALLQEPV